MLYLQFTSGMTGFDSAMKWYVSMQSLDTEAL